MIWPRGDLTIVGSTDLVRDALVRQILLGPTIEISGIV
jgi:hypothetical protein